jgi:hypothetical protein
MENKITSTLVLVTLAAVLIPLVALGIIFSLNLMGLGVAYSWSSVGGASLLMFLMKWSSSPLPTRRG